MNLIEKNIIKLMRATLGEVELTDAIQNRISQRLNAERQVAAMQAFSEHLPLFPEMSLLEKHESAIEAELEVPNFLWDFPFMIVVPEELSSEQQIESKKLSPLQLLLPGFESHLETFHCHIWDKFYSSSTCHDGINRKLERNDESGNFRCRQMEIPRVVWRRN